ncbi:MAG: substrate-binding domain-containing protein [Pseudomonadota bacterium]
MKHSLYAGAAIAALSAGPVFAAGHTEFTPGEGPFDWASYEAWAETAPDLSGQQVTVFGPWLTPEDDRMRSILSHFASATGADVVYTGSDGFEQQILIDAEAGSAPNIGVFPQPGLAAVMASKGQLFPLEDSMGDWIRDNYAAGQSWVDVNNRGAFEIAAEELIRLGHRDIGLINGLETMDFARSRREGMVGALTRHGITPDPAYFASGEMTESAGYSEAGRMLSLPNPPTAFLAASFIAALGIRRAVGDAGLTLGKDVSLITHDDDLSYLNNGGDQPIFTTVRSSVRDAGRMAASMLLSQIDSGDRTPIHRELEVEFVNGPSTGTRKVAPHLEQAGTG